MSCIEDGLMFKPPMFDGFAANVTVWSMLCWMRVK